MARVSVTTVPASLVGAVCTPVAPTVDGDIIDTGNVLLIVAAGATPTTVTIRATKTIETLALANAVGTVAANTERAFGPFPASLFAQASDAAVGPSRVLVDYSAIATITRRVVAL